MYWLDRLAAEILAPLAVWVFASGLDDLFLDFAYLVLRFRSRGLANATGPGRASPGIHENRDDFLATSAFAEPSGPASLLRIETKEPCIALIVPCWHEADVIERMLDTNLTAIEYLNYEVWLGVYPNDPATIECVLAAERRFPRIRHAICPRDGPTTKADCLNAIYAALQRHEALTGRRYEIIVQHDAEDMIHPQSLQALAKACERFDMVQAPVFPLRTPVHRFTHGAYCDEFAEFHLKDLYVRSRLGGFVPSAGVGTAYRRDALERLAESRGGRLFEPESLTEDYVMGLEMHRLGLSQTLLHCSPAASEGDPASGKRKGLVATRAYFPFGARAAVRQRTRWVTGNALQSWMRFGWRAGPGQWYWLWRDRKGLAGSPATALANLLFLYGTGRWVSLGNSEWILKEWWAANPILGAVLATNLALVCWRQVVRAACTVRLYGWLHASMTPLRTPWGNLLNFCATARALALFSRARLLHRPLRWAKTSHEYPIYEGATGERRRLGKILISTQVLSVEQIERAAKHRYPDERLGEALLRQRLLGEEQLYLALALQAGLPFLNVAPGEIEESARDYLHALGAHVSHALPFRVALESLWLAVSDAPSEPLRQQISRASKLPVRFVMVTASNLVEIRKALGRGPALARSPAARPARRLRWITPARELRIPLPFWMDVRRLSVSLEYRRG